MQLLGLLFSNKILNVAVMSWAAAQLIKVCLNLILTRRLIWERMVGSGGMPSSHSSFVCGVAVAIGRSCGFGTAEFALAFTFAMVVMYDAMGVRRAAGEQAKALNNMSETFAQLIEAWRKEYDAKTRGEELSRFQEESDRKLKELLGHTPLEVVCGAILGIAIGAWMPI